MNMWAMCMSMSDISALAARVAAGLAATSLCAEGVGVCDVPGMLLMAEEGFAGAADCDWDCDEAGDCGR
ncbi:MAG: hypothetical protein WBE43_12395, partial [Candidatus Acidiferrales bacterium]